MKFRNRVRNKVYVVRPQNHIVQPDGSRVLDYGIRVEFQNHLWDSEEAQKRDGWSDETREQVEKYLILHRDWNHGLTRVDKTDAEILAEVGAAEAPNICVAPFVVQGKSQPCGRPVADGGDLCPEHAEQFAQAMAAQEA